MKLCPANENALTCILDLDHEGQHEDWSGKKFGPTEEEKVAAKAREFTPEHAETLANNLSVLQTMLAKKVFTPEQYYKGVIIVAYEFACREQVQTALNLVLTIPHSYYTTALEGQMAEDDAFYGIAHGLGTTLVKNGYATLETAELRATQPSASA
jgi:hypothetical protein